MKIIVADDHTLFREGLRHLLAQLAADLALFEAADHDGLATLIDRHPDADLVLVDLAMPGQDGLAALDGLVRAAATTPVVVLSASEEPETIRRALDCGAAGFIPKREKTAVMLSALRLVLSGGVYLPPMLVQAGAAGGGGRTALTPRQRDVLHYLIEGRSNKDIGRRLDLSEATVKAHISAIFKVLGVRNRTQAARAAGRLGLLAPPSQA
jgi:DNA-binding NarL/FixJ family response regulator